MKGRAAFTAFATVSLAVCAAGAGYAKDPPAAPKEPAILKQIVDCRAIRDSSARLACFDTSTAALDTALAAKDVYVVERKQVRETRRSLFGFNLPNLRLFGGDDETDKLDQIDSTVARASEGGDGSWQVTLADGSVWRQTDGRPIALAPRAGGAVTIKRGSLGSYKMSIGKQPAVKVERLR